MKRARWQGCWTVLVVIPFIGACNGGPGPGSTASVRPEASVGAPGPDDGVEGWCSQPTREPVLLNSLGDPCGEWTGAEILAFANEEYRTILETPGYPPSPLTIRVRYRGGDILCYPPEAAPPGTRGPDLPASLSVVVEIEFVSEDGAFREIFETPLTGAPHGAAFCRAFRPDELAGAIPKGTTGSPTTRLVIQGHFGGERTFGSIVRGEVRPGHVPSSTLLADWDNR